MHYIKFSATIFLLFFFQHAFSPTSADLKPDAFRYIAYPKLVDRFYELNGNKLFWFRDGDESFKLRTALINELEGPGAVGVNKEKYQLENLKEIADKIFPIKDSINARQADRSFTNAAITYSKEIYQGASIGKWIGYDEFSDKYEESDNTFLLNRMVKINTAKELIAFFNSLDPPEDEFNLLKNELQNQLKVNDSYKRLELITTMNLYRWIHHFKFQKFIVINIGSATLRYYETDNLSAKMKVVVGKTSTKTPRFAASCNQVILYPYWNVPTSIALKELLPKFKRDPGQVDAMNMQILDSKGRIISPHALNWKAYSKGYFPFRIRQSTGCDNSLGVIKFNLTSPFSVYLHDTNNKSVFLLRSRYLSHGCIRLQEPMKLANFLLPNRIDNKFLEACLKDQKPVTIDLAQTVPVFVVYMPAEINEKGNIEFYKDVYQLLK
jgi:murein L,D-transpeptidase YcbB/YkuD